MIKITKAKALMLSALNQAITKFELTADETEGILQGLIADIRQQINIENVNEMLMMEKKEGEKDGNGDGH